MAATTAHDVQTLLAADPIDVDALASALDALPAADRVPAVRAIGGKAQARLWDALEGRGTTLEDFLPPGTAPGAVVIHYGKNSLPAFKQFEKRFTPVDGDPTIAWGYNEASIGKLIGPGFFVARYFEQRGEVGIDYFQWPPEGAALPAGWPALKPNTSGLQRWIYHGMIDYMRKVSSHVTLGRAYKGGDQATPNYFLLCRGD